MSESLRKKLVFATLPIAVIWAFFNYPGGNDAPARPSPEQATTPATRAVVKAAPHRPLIDLEQQELEAWGTDPFRSYTTRAADVKPKKPAATRLEWILGGIVYNHSNPLALINKKAVRIGDRVGLATVVEINKKSVTLEYQGRRITLKINKG